MSETVDLTKGGNAVVFCGATGFVQEFASNPQVHFIKCNEVAYDELETKIPFNTRIVIMTDGIPNAHHMWISSFVRRKSIPYLIRRSNQAVYDSLKLCFNGDNSKVTPEEAKETQIKGKLNFLVEHINFSESNTENARRLLRIATEKGIRTTIGSLAQLVSNHRKHQGGTAVVKSARTKLDLSVNMLDDAIKGLTDIRDFLIATTEENRLLKQRIEKITKAME